MKKSDINAAWLALDKHSAFDPSHFRTDFGDPAIGAIPAKKVDLGIEQRRAKRFAMIPLAATPFYPPQARLLILLSALQKLRASDLDGGWYKLSASRYKAVGLHDKDVRARAVAACERSGAIEVLRLHRKTIHIRFTEVARLAHQIPPRQ